MKIIVNGTELSSAVMKVSKAISVKTTNPVLEGIKLSVRGDNLTLTATDTEFAIEKTIRSDTFREGDTVVPGRLFAELVKKLENENEVELFLIEENRLKITYGNNEVFLSTLSAETFPEIKKNLKEKYFTLLQKEYKELINKTIFACSTDESRPILKGCLFDIKDGVLKCVGLDGFRMAIAEKRIKEASGDFKIIIPARALNEIGRLLERDEEEMTIVSEENTMMVDDNGTIFVSRLLEGDFINYEQIIPSKFQTVVTFKREDFQNSLDRATIVAKDARNIVKLEIKENHINIKANSEKGNVTENVLVNIEGVDMDINFNAKYITEALKSISDEYVKLSFVGEIAPAIITSVSGGDYLYLILPIRIG